MLSTPRSGSVFDNDDETLALMGDEVRAFDGEVLDFTGVVWEETFIDGNTFLSRILTLAESRPRMSAELQRSYRAHVTFGNENQGNRARKRGLSREDFYLDDTCSWAGRLHHNRLARGVRLSPYP